MSVALLLAGSLAAQSDRGPGIRTSMVETYVEPGQFIIYPFYAYSWDHNYEYQPSMFGIGLDQDFHGTYRTNEAQLFLAYGVTDWLAVELEGSRIIADFTKDPNDASGTPASLRESGTADIAGQIRLRLAPERGRRPELFAAVELLPPQQSGSALIGDEQWDVKGELGAARAYRWGTMTFRTTIEYNRGDTHWDLGETSLEYLKRLSPAWRRAAGDRRRGRRCARRLDARVCGALARRARHRPQIREWAGTVSEIDRLGSSDRCLDQRWAPRVVTRIAP